MSKENEVRNFLIAEVASLSHLPQDQITDETELMGDATILDSASLVTLFLACEDFLDENYQKKFDWYSDGALGRNSPLRSVGSTTKLLLEKIESVTE